MATCGRQNCRVLVVDDSEDIARLIQNYAEGEPIEVSVVATAEEGLETLRETPFDLVLMDFHLPGMDGAAGVLSMRLMERQLKRRPVPVFALTDLMDRDSGEQMLRAGCTALLGKPLSRQQFLTIASRGRQRSAEIEPEKETGAKPLNILIVEDSPDSRLLLKVFLTGSPHRLTFAGNGQIAVDRFAAETFDLILMDMNMPIMDGLTATRTIRAFEQERGTIPIPIVAITGNQGPQDAALSGAAGCDQHLSKPISKRQLIETIENTTR